MDHWRLAFHGRHELILGFDPDANDDPWNETAVRRSLRERDPLLFDLDADAGEGANLAEEGPAVVDRLDDALATIRGD